MSLPQNPYNQPPQATTRPQRTPQEQQTPPMLPIPVSRLRKMSRREWMAKRLMAGKAIIADHLPNWFASYAIFTYVVALIGVNIIFSNYATEWYFWLFGIAWVAGFFYLSVDFSRKWNLLHVRKSRDFEKKLFWTGFLIRVAYAFFIYFFYIEMTGQPHEFAAADSIAYIETAQWLAAGWKGSYMMDVVSNLVTTSLGDAGFPLYLFLPVLILEGDVVVLVICVVNAMFGAYTSVIVYRMATRLMGENIARLAAIFCMWHPVLICYVGMTLKEVFMTWLLVLFIDMADRMLVGKKYSLATIAPVVLVGLTLFLFRTVLGMVAFMAVFFALMMMETKLVGWGKKFILSIVLAGVLLLSVSDNIMREINQIRETDIREQQENTMVKRYGSEKGGTISGNKFANYAGAAVFAPLIFTIPFPTMVNIGFQEDMRLIHGGNWMRNVMSGFVILAMFMLLLTGDWRKYTLMVAVLLGYLVVLIFSAFAHSLRFHIPVMPLEMIFAAYAIMNMRKKQKFWYLLWCLFMILTCFGWNWMKLRGRGL